MTHSVRVKRPQQVSKGSKPVPHNKQYAYSILLNLVRLYIIRLTSIFRLRLLKLHVLPGYHGGPTKLAESSKTYRAVHLLPKHRFIISTHSVTCFGRSFRKLDSSGHGMDRMKPKFVKIQKMHLVISSAGFVSAADRLGISRIAP